MRLPPLGRSSLGAFCVASLGWAACMHAPHAARANASNVDVVAPVAKVPANAPAQPAALPTQPGAQDFYRGKVVVLSGAEGGMGVALCAALLEAGAKIYAGVHQLPATQALAALQQRHGAALVVAPLDVTQDASVQAFVGRLQDTYIDVLINNAGVNVDKRHRLLEPMEDRFVQSFAVNTLGAVRLTQALAQHLHQCGRPVVANVTSVMGSIGENHVGGSPAYRMSKAATNMFTRELAIEEPTLVALALHPGWVKTKMGGAHADITPEVAAQGLLQVMATAGPAQSGQFFRYSGDVVGW